MNKLIYYLFYITLFFNIWLPKGGVKVAGLPLTFGNISFGLLTICFLLSLKDKKIIKRNIFKVMVVTCLYFFVRILIATFSYSTSVTDIAQYIVPLTVYPAMYFFTIQVVKTKEDIEKVMKVLIFGLIFICVYGLMQYFLGIDKVTIPGITMNISDYTGKYWYLQKYNGVSEDTKVFSTYQNGNLFGVSLILIFPIIFEYLHNKYKDDKKRRSIPYILLILFSVVILLTLSRSCWFGLGIYILFRFILTKVNSLKELLIKISMIPIGGTFIVYLLKRFPQITQRLQSTSLENLIGLGGRTDGLVGMLNSLKMTDSFFILFVGFFGLYDMQGFAYEITPAAIWMVGGMIGLFLWYFNIYLAVKECGNNNPISIGAKQAIIIWLLVSIIEGAFWLPPTVLNLWFVLGLASNCKYILNKEDVSINKV